MDNNESIVFEYGAMSSRFSLKATDKRTAYAAMIMHFGRNAHLVALYEPKDIVEGDSWLNVFGKIAKRLDEVFGGPGSFERYCESHLTEISAAYDSIRRLI